MLTFVQYPNWTIYILLFNIHNCTLHAHNRLQLCFMLICVIGSDCIANRRSQNKAKSRKDKMLCHDHLQMLSVPQSQIIHLWFMFI